MSSRKRIKELKPIAVVRDVCSPTPQDSQELAKLFAAEPVQIGGAELVLSNGFAVFPACRFARFHKGGAGAAGLRRAVPRRGNPAANSRELS